MITSVQPMKVKLLMKKVLANVSPEYAKAWNLPEGHTSVGFFSTDNDDVAYLAVDDATKKANIQVVRAETFWGGNDCSWSAYGGGVFVMFSGPKIADVKSGMNSVQDFVDRQSMLQNFDGDRAKAFYAQTIPRIGSYFAKLCDIPEGTSISYLVGGPIETSYAIDKALKAGNTKIGYYWFPPSHANSSGAILYGTESACKSATQAFVEALKFAIDHPMDI